MPATVAGVKWVRGETVALVELGWVRGVDSDVAGLESDWVGSVDAPATVVGVEWARGDSVTLGWARVGDSDVTVLDWIAFVDALTGI